MQNQIPNNWQKVKLGEVAEDVRNLYEPKKTENLSYIGLEHIEQGSLRLNGIGKSSETKSSKKIFKENDILFGTLRSYFRKIVKPKFSGVCSTDIAVIRAKENNDQNFLFYFMANPYFINFASSPGEGTKMPRAKWSYLSETEWFIPKFEEQKRIGLILSSFDDKIELNNKISKTLEKMASAIFKEWFLKFRFPGWEKTEFFDSEIGKIPKGWETKLIKDFGETVTGKTPSTEDKTNFGSDYPFITIPDLNNIFIIKTERYLSNKGACKIKSLILPKNTICVSCIATVGLVGITVRESYTNQQINSIIPSKEYYLYYLFNFFKTKKKDLEMFGSGGTATLIINKTKFEILEIIKPDDIILNKFYLLVKPMYEKILKIILENLKLTPLRDLLLPKLMKGEIRV